MAKPGRPKKNAAPALDADAAVDNVAVDDAAVDDAPASKAPAVEIIARGDFACGDGRTTAGQKMATVTLEPGVDLNWLVGSIANGKCGTRLPIARP